MVQFIRCGDAGENRALEKKCVDMGLDIEFGRVEQKIPALRSKIRATFVHAGLEVEEALA